MNKLTLEGNVARDPQITPTKDGRGLVARITIAVDREGRRGADFIPVVAFGDAAEQINARVGTGTKVKIIGRVSHSPKHGLDLVVDYIGILDRALVVA